jgi:hypothetical protein
MDPDPGGPKTCGSGGFEFGSGTLVSSIDNYLQTPGLVEFVYDYQQ